MNAVVAAPRVWFARCGAPAAHPFFCQQRLLERGRWPFGVFADAGRAVAAIL